MSLQLEDLARLRVEEARDRGLREWSIREALRTGATDRRKKDARVRRGLARMAVATMALLLISTLAASAHDASPVGANSGGAGATCVNGRTGEVVLAAATPGACTFSADEIRSMRAVYVKEAGIWLARTSRGFAGYDGGALGMLECASLEEK